MTDDAKLGHNGGPPLDEAAGTLPRQCRYCIHWNAPSDSEQQAYRYFLLGLSRRRVKRPAGACDRVLLGSRTTPAFSATTAEFGCRNFRAAPPKPPLRRGGFVTIWQEGRIVWQGNEADMPSRFLQQEFDL